MPQKLAVVEWLETALFSTAINLKQVEQLKSVALQGKSKKSRQKKERRREKGLERECACFMPTIERVLVEASPRISTLWVWPCESRTYLSTRSQVSVLGGTGDRLHESALYYDRDVEGELSGLK